MLEPTCLRLGSARRVVYGSGVRAPSSESLGVFVSYVPSGGGRNPYILTFKVILRDRELANVKGSMTDFAILNCPGRCKGKRVRYCEAHDVVIRERGGL